MKMIGMMRWSSTILAAGCLVLGMAGGASGDPKLQQVGAPTEKISLGLHDFKTAVTAKSLSPGEADGIGGVQVRGGRVLLTAHVEEVTPSLLADLEQLGAIIAASSERYHRVDFDVTALSVIEAAAALPEVIRVVPRSPAVTNRGLVTSRAVKAHRIDQARQRYGVDGTGVRIGVLSDSFALTEGTRGPDTTPPLIKGPAGTVTMEPGPVRRMLNQDSGDLPGTIQVLREYNGAGGSDEGAAMAELIHDIAPGAEILFHTAFISEANFAEGIIRLAQAGCQIIVDDVIYLTAPFYQDGLVAQAVDYVTENYGVTYFSASGNFSNRAFRTPYRNSNPAVNDQEAFPPTGNDFHLWDNGTAFLPVGGPAGQSVRIMVGWNQPYESISGTRDGGSQIDLDAYFVHEPTVEAVRRLAETGDRRYGFRSIDRQGRTGQPMGDAIEFLAAVPDDPFAPVNGYLVIDHYRGMQEHIPQSPNVPLEIRTVFYGVGVKIGGINSNLRTHGGPAMWGHNVARGAISVGAVPWYDTPRFNTGFRATPEIDPEDFSALGGYEGLTPGGALRIWFDPRGRILRNPLTGRAEPSLREVPTLAAVNGNNTTFFGRELDLRGFEGEPDGFPNFFGTSASAPNAAAIAALIKELNPQATPHYIRTVLKDTAIDVRGRRAAPGPDDVSGHGLINARAALDMVASSAGIEPRPAPDAKPPRLPRQEFRFVGESEGWIFQDHHDFIPPEADFDIIRGALVLTTRDNSNTFGWFVSPGLIAGEWEREGDLPLIGQTGPGSLYRVTYDVSSNVKEVEDVPTIRFRASTKDFGQTAELVINSATPGQPLAAKEGAPRVYSQYFSLPANMKRFRLYFDVLGFAGMGAPDSSMVLDRVRVDALSMASLEFGRQERTYDFQNPETEHWEPLGAAEFNRPALRRTADGLELGPSHEGHFPPGTGDANVWFGYFSSPEHPVTAFPYRFQADRLYRARYTVSAQANTIQRFNMPTLRARVNDSSLNMAATLTIGSTPGSVWINEIHYANNGPDVNEGIELAGAAHADLNGWSLAFYRQEQQDVGGGTVSRAVLYNHYFIDGEIPNQVNGFGTRWLPVEGIAGEHQAAGVALLDAGGGVVQALAWNGGFTASGGPAAGRVFEDIGVREGSETPVGRSIQLQGAGNRFSEFTWAANQPATRGAFNTGQEILPFPERTRHDLFFAGNEYVDGNEMLFAIDYLLVDGLSDPNVTIRLEKVQVDSWPKPFLAP